jgi:hypothetical protein
MKNLGSNTFINGIEYQLLIAQTCHSILDNKIQTSYALLGITVAQAHQIQSTSH